MLLGILFFLSYHIVIYFIYLLINLIDKYDYYKLELIKLYYKFIIILFLKIVNYKLKPPDLTKLKYGDNFYIYDLNLNKIYLSYFNHKYEQKILNNNHLFCDFIYKKNGIGYCFSKPVNNIIFISYKHKILIVK